MNLLERKMFKDISVNKYHINFIKSLYEKKSNFIRNINFNGLKYIKKLFLYTDKNEWYDCVSNYINSKQKTLHNIDFYRKVYGTGCNILYDMYIHSLSVGQKESYKNTNRQAMFDHFFAPYWIKKGYSQKESEEIVEKRKKLAKKNSIKKMETMDDRVPCQKGYWIKRGFSEEEAKQKVSERQSTFSKEKCIAKYGEVEGLKKWQERQDKWQNTLKIKSEEELLRINKLKSLSCPISKQERELGINLKMQNQFIIGNNIQYVYDLRKGNKIIEYNGDYWHCNPKIYDKDYYNKKIKMFAEEKWNYDNLKINFAKKNGYDVLVIWEMDYKKAREKIINKCLEFING